MDQRINILILLVAIGITTLSAFDPGDTLSNCVPRRSRPNCRGFLSINSYRTFDGTCNNKKHPLAGAVNTALDRLIDADYADRRNLDTPRGFPGTPHVPPANQVSIAAFQASKKRQNNRDNLSTMFMTTGQFLDHDVGLSLHPSCSNTDCSSNSAFTYPCFPIRFKKNGQRCTPFARAFPQCQRGQGKVRQQVNVLSAFIDGSQIYGSTDAVAQSLRVSRTSGFLKVRPGNLLPLDLNVSPCNTIGGCSLSGDIRADENVALYSMHTLWVREHNRIVRVLRRQHKSWNGEKLYQETRKIVVAEWQHIVYTEWLPHIVKLHSYSGYNAKVKPKLINAFSTAAFRFGHSLVPNSFKLLNKHYNPVTRPITLQESFFNINTINNRGINPVVIGLLANRSNEVDTKFAFGLARRLFVKVGETDHMDLTALNIQRGRDHGIPTYGAWRRFCKLPVRSWSNLHKDIPRAAVRAFKKLYKKVSDIDLFAAGIAENHARGLTVGPTFSCIFKHQFARLRDGDRFFYRRTGVFKPVQLNQIRRVTMARIVCDNINGLVSIHKNAFLFSNKKRTLCNKIKKVNLKVF